MVAAGDIGHPGRIPLDVLHDTIQPFPTFSEAFGIALTALHGEVTYGPGAAGTYEVHAGSGPR